MFQLITDPGFWASLFSVTLIQVALGADNLIIVTIIANKLPESERDKAVRWGLILAMLFRVAPAGDRQLGAHLRHHHAIRIGHDPAGAHPSAPRSAASRCCWPAAAWC